MMEIFKVKYVLGVILFIVYGNTWAGAPAPAHVDHKQVDLCTANDQILVDVHRSLRSVFNNAYLSMLEGMGDSFIARDDMADFSEFTGLKGKSILQADAVWKDLYNTIGYANAVILKLAQTI